MILRSFLCLVVAAGCLAAQMSSDACDPAPGETDVSLPMPLGGRLVFRPIRLGVKADEAYAVRRVKLGQRDGDFKESLRETDLGGHFTESPTGEPYSDWVYFLGKYELSRAQWDAVMLGTLPTSDADVPVQNISFYEVQEFLRRYNEWLFANHRTALPKNRGTFGFVRLPSEAEWEFAVRGGIEVSADDYAAPVPYKESLARYENFQRPSGRNGPRAIGKKKPGPTGLYDALGNVAEMTEGSFRVDYLEGRAGGVAVRGGHFDVPERQVRSSRRIEQALWDGAGQPRRAETVGLRVAIGCPVFLDDMAFGERLRESFVGRSSAARGARAEPAAPDRPLSADVNEAVARAQTALGRVEKLLAERPDAETSLQELVLSLQEVVRTANQNDQHRAETEIHNAASRLVLFAERSARAETLRGQLDQFKQESSRALIQSKIADAESDARFAVRNYQASLEWLYEVAYHRPELVDQAFRDALRDFETRSRDGDTLDRENWQGFQVFTSLFVQRDLADRLRARRFFAVSVTPERGRELHAKYKEVFPKRG